MTRPVLSLAWARPDLPRPSVVIAPEPFGCGYDVSVVPTQDGIGHDRELPTYAEASEYASRLAERTGWRLVDLTSDGGRAA